MNKFRRPSRGKQTMTNISEEDPRGCAIGGRSFSPGGGIAIVPLGDRPKPVSPSKYAMYEDSAIINVKGEGRQTSASATASSKILAPPRKAEAGLRHHRRFGSATRLPNDMLFRESGFPAFPGPRLQRGPLGSRSRSGIPPAPRIETRNRSVRAKRLKVRRIGILHGRTGGYSRHPFPQEGAAARPEGAGRAGRENRRLKRNDIQPA